MRQMTTQVREQVPLAREKQESRVGVRERRWPMLLALGVLGSAILVMLITACSTKACGCEYPTNPAPGAIAAAQSFYQVLQQRDYAVAAQQLTGDATLAGQRVTPTQFVTLAEEMDTRRGNVQLFQIGASDAQVLSHGNPFIVVVTVHVTRGKQTYAVHMRLVNNGPGWKIASLDTV
ncbi:MAG: hypothetical protein NVS3B14_19280 [Ktedonobacteraceae bacterium]